MNDILTRKIGEVLAFERATVETFTKGHSALLPILLPDVIKASIGKANEVISRLEVFAKEQNISGIVFDKAERTAEKLMKMRDTYLMDRWDDGIEIMEWLGFFEGAAIIHWELVSGGARNEKYIDLENQAMDMVNHHMSLLNIISKKVKSVFEIEPEPGD